MFLGDYVAGNSTGVDLDAFANLLLYPYRVTSKPKARRPYLSLSVGEIGSGTSIYKRIDVSLHIKGASANSLIAVLGYCVLRKS